MLIAIPSEAPGGLDAVISDHFGHCAAFTLVEIEDGVVGEVRVVENQEHAEGGCLAPVTMLKEQSVDAMVAGGMGMRPLAGFRQVGIKVFSKADTKQVREAVQLFAEDKAQEFDDNQTCGGGGGHCGGHGHGHHHHHEDIPREPIEGKADVRADRVVSFDYVLTNSEGELVETTQNHEPARYLHGHGNIMPVLEAALTGLEVGDTKTVELAAKDAYGVRDEARLIEVPLDQLPPGIAKGAVLRAQDPDGGMAMLTVVDFDDSSAKLDGNHPLAGQDLTFDVKVTKVEAATPDEVEHGHAH